MKTKSGRGKIPGFGLSLGLSLSYMSFLILIPISALIIYAAKIPTAEYFKIISDERVIAAFKVSFFSAIAAALLNFVFGFIIAWILARHNFFGKKIVDACIDLPFAIPTAVAGISLAMVFSSNGFMGKFLSLFNISLEYSRVGIGEKTAAAARAYGMEVYVSEEATIKSMVEKIKNKFSIFMLC